MYMGDLKRPIYTILSWVFLVGTAYVVSLSALNQMVVTSFFLFLPELNGILFGLLKEY